MGNGSSLKVKVMEASDEGYGGLRVHCSHCRDAKSLLRFASVQSWVIHDPRLKMHF